MEGLAVRLLRGSGLVSTFVESALEAQSNLGHQGRRGWSLFLTGPARRLSPAARFELPRCVGRATLLGPFPRGPNGSLVSFQAEAELASAFVREGWGTTTGGEDVGG